MTTKPSNRRLFDVGLTPVSGSRFQPTGFPDIGAALFQRPAPNGEWVDALLLESAQSMANHLEATAWDTALHAPVSTFDGLPYVIVVDEADGYVTSSRTESHRLASAFIKDSDLDGKNMKEVIKERLGLRDDTPLAPREIARAIFALDPFALLHGVFFAENSKVWPGQPKVARAVSAFVEAIDVRRADSGGVKRDEVRHAIGEGDSGSAEGYGSIPFHRTEWTAREITAYFNVDLAQIRSYGLPAPATELLEATALWEIRSLIDGGLRLRTACDLAANGEVIDRSGVPLERLDSLEGRLRQLIPEVVGELGLEAPLRAQWSGGKKKSKSA